MNKEIRNESIRITPLQNGYMVGYAYSKLTDPEETEKYNKYSYIEEKSTFKTWDEVVDFIKTKQLTLPAVELN